MDDAMRKNNSIVGHCLIILTQIILGLNIPITRDILLNYLTPLAYIAVRALITALFFGLVYCFQKQEKIEKHDFMLMLLGGFLGFVFSQYLTSKSLQYTTPVYFSLILALSPVVVLILQAICFGEKITQKIWLELVSAFSTQRFLPFERLWKKAQPVRIICWESDSPLFQ